LTAANQGHRLASIVVMHPGAIVPADAMRGSAAAPAGKA
jgi:hypothetical protein